MKIMKVMMMSDKKHKSIVEVFIDTFVEHVAKDIQTILDALPDDLDSEGDKDE